MFNNDHIDVLIAREIEGDISAAEQAELQTWLQADAANRQYYEALRKTWDLAGEAADDAPEPDVIMNWQRFQLQMQQQGTEQQEVPAPLRVVTPRRNWWRLAAAAVVIIAAAGLAFTLFTINAGTTIITAAADKKEVTLPDGSKIFLNRNSQISYRKGFAAGHRNVKLEGEAFFDVVPDASNPFIVSAGASQTQVLGTSFVIKAYEDKTVQLNVVTGKVAFSGQQKDEDALVLTAGHTAILQHNKKPQEIQDADPNFMAWKENRLHFSNIPLNRTLNTLEEYFSVRFIAEDASILMLTYTGTFDHPTLQEVLDVISTAAHVTFTEEEKGVYRISR